ncbi:MAG: chloride channel protein [Oscillospiraceae bacterium]|nr:chloride channel protein [Oscillospiraceae bacterium]
MTTGKNILKELNSNIRFGIKWIIISLILGSICGLVGAAFHHAIDWVTAYRQANSFLVWLMPVGGIAIVFLYHSVGLHNQPGTNTIIQSVRQQEKVPRRLSPAIFIATVITHLVGGSSGREGAALQIGGSLATTFGRIIKADVREMSILVMCGMSAVFSALFGTPITATIFSMEVVSVGLFYYSALVPCLCSSLVAFFTARLLGCHSVHYTLDTVLEIDVTGFAKILALALCVAVVSICFVLAMHKGHKLFHHYIHNPYIRVVAGSVMLMALVVLFGTDYLGAGMDAVDMAIYGSETVPYAFILKIIFTAITIGCGFKGGEIVPTFFIGATLGYTVCTVIALDPHLGAALGIVGLFCCVINSPITSLILGIELFGSANLVPMAIMVAFCYVLSGYFSLYSAQKIVYSKTSPEYINKDAM